MSSIAPFNTPQQLDESITFLDEITKQEAEAQVGASKKAAQMKFMKK